MKLRVTSPVLDNNGLIPAKYTCDGEDVNPPLNIEGIPQGTKARALLGGGPVGPCGLLGGSR